MQYKNVPNLKNGGDIDLLKRIVKQTPLPKGKNAFSSIHVIAPADAKEKVSQAIVATLRKGNEEEVKKELHVHDLNFKPTTSKNANPMDEYAAVFTVARLDTDKQNLLMMTIFKT